MTNEPEVLIGCVANLWSKQMHFLKAGDMHRGHSHCFDHLTLLAAGSMRVVVEGGTTDFKAPTMIYIQAEKHHELTALEDNTVAYCIHALRTGERVEDVLDPSMVPEGVNPRGLALPLVNDELNPRN